jgi:hypothetical protein
MAIKADIISVEKSEFIQECKFRHSLNSAISTSEACLESALYGF